MPATDAPLCEWALHYASKGVPVFPVAPKTKIPLRGSKGVDDATTDKDQIRFWWATNPHANIGAACGYKFDVADIDSTEGQECFKKNCKKSAVVASSRTPSGGYHCFFEPCLAPMTNGVKKLPGIDLRTKGGYVLLPPSRVIDEEKGIDGIYSWREGQELNGKPLGELPRFLQEAFKRKREEGPSLVVPEVFPDGERNDRLFRFGCSMRAKGSNEFEIRATLAAMNEIRCSPPLEAKEIQEIASKCCRYQEGPIRDYSGLTKPSPLLPYNEYREQIESQFIKLSSVEGKPVDWLFERRFAKGMLSMVQGDPGEGKSTIARALTAMVTTGRAPGFWGMKTDGPRDVIWLTKEESLVYSVVPALTAMGADLDRIHALAIDIDEDGKLPPDFIFNDWGIQQLRELIEATGAAIIIIDPLMAFFDSNTDMHRQNETRAVLSRLIQMAAMTDVVPLGIVHQSKGKNNNALLNIIGSVDFGAACRTAFMVGHDPDDRDKKAFVCTKNNLGRWADPIGFEIEDDGQILWDEHCSLNAERLNEPPSSKAKREKGDACKDWLEKELQYGQHEVTSLIERGKEQGFSKSLIYEASTELKVSRGNQPTAKRGRGPAWWAKSGYRWDDHNWPDPFED